MATKTQFAANSEIRMGSKNGHPQYALTDDQGRVKFSLRCGCCKLSSYVWLAARYYQGQSGQIVPCDCREAMSHLDDCPTYRTRMEKYLDTRPNTTADTLQSMKESYFDMFCLLTTFGWVKRPEGGHKCSAKCVNATGHTCECSCRGRNHKGGN